jgi:trans-aconitate methyltransferase
MAKSVTRPDLDAMHYRNHSSYQYESAMNLLATHSFKENDRLLDVGCGDGRITAELSKRLPKGKVVGLDLSPSMISLAKDSFSKEAYPNLEYHVCNAEEIPYKEQFDAVMSVNCLHWVEDKRKAFHGMMEALVPGGDLLILMGTKDEDLPNFFIEASKDKKWEQYAPHPAYSKEMSIAECREMLEELGAQVRVCEVKEKIASFDSKEEFASFIKIWVNYYFPLPEALQQEYLNQVIDGVANYSIKTEDERIHLPFKGLVIKARKI